MTGADRPALPMPMPEAVRVLKALAAWDPDAPLADIRLSIAALMEALEDFQSIVT